jgi:photosystem II stability/assembly factor-like uncharacterized protein
MRRPGSTPSNFLFHRYSLASLTGALLLVASLSLPAGPALAQAKGGNRAAAAETGAIHQPGHIVYDTSLYAGLQYRMIGPFRGGRATAVAGVSQKPHTFYLGATGGGVWKTEDAGQHWDNVSDGYFHVGSIGAITVAPSDPDVVYVGTGSADVRGNVSTGKGVYRSTDGGKSWSFEGLEDAGQIGDIVVSPRDPDLVYLASIGHAFGPNPTRGVFRSRDGGKTWQKVLFVSDSTGFIDLAMDPNNPRVLYAAAWQTERKPWTIVSGGHEGGIWKSTDGGDHWTKLGGGLPTGLVGKASVTVSPADPDLVWVLIEASPIDKGGVYRSDDAGKTWRQTSHSHDLTQRAFYYIHIFADPKDPNTVYALNTSPYRSIDGGKTFTRIRVPHGDTHDFWINPEHPDYLAIADDGGAQVSLTHGKTWSTYYNQPTAQFYRVITDNGFPYRVYGPQQDNSTISVPAWSPGTGRLTPQGEWVTVGGGESGYIALDPDHPKLSYAGSYGGDIDRMDRETGQGQNVVAYPQLALGEAAKDLKYRFQWNAPILMSKFDSSVVYHAAQYVLKTTNGGQSWTRISPDLTRDDTAKQVLAGKPIESEETGVEVYGTIFALAEGSESPDVLWAGSDDGLVHLTRDGGKTWKDVTPPGLPAYSTVNVIAPSPHQAGQAYVTAYRYRMDDWHPYVYETKDWGAHWTRIADGTRGIPAGDPVRVVREDPVRAGLLYAGTEFGMYVSFDDGAHWQTLQQNLPPVPVTDLTVHGSDLVLATQGRSFWILDDVTPLRQLTGAVAKADHYLFEPRAAYRANMGRGFGGGDRPTPPPSGAILDYYMARKPDGPVKLEIIDPSGKTVQTFSSKKKEEEGEPSELAAFFGGGRSRPLPASEGMHRYTWNLRYPGVHTSKGAVVWGYTGGPQAVPGTYTARLIVGSDTTSRSFDVKPDPRWRGVTHQDLVEQFELAVAMRDTLNHVYGRIDALRSARGQVKAAEKRAKDAGVDVTARADSLVDDMTALEKDLIQTQNRSGQDPIRFPPQFDNQVAAVYGNVAGPDAKPTDGARERWNDLLSQWSGLRDRLGKVLDTDLGAFNQLLQQKGVPAVVAPNKDEDAASGEGEGRSVGQEEMEGGGV